MKDTYTVEELNDILANLKQQGSGVTQYIGARYVPLFADPIDWSDTRTYEPLTIVYHKGNSYTSRQSVPTGIDIENESFWALTGNYNAQIEQYRTEVASCREEVKAYGVRITANTEAIATNAQEIANETSRATAAEATKAPIGHASGDKAYGVGTASMYGHVKLATQGTPASSDATAGIAATPASVKSAIDSALGDSIKPKNTIIVLGDSFTSTRDRAYAWPSQITRYNVVNLAKDGAAFTTPSNNIQEQADLVRNQNLSTVKAVVVYAGYNDLQIGATFDALDTAIKKVYETISTAVDKKGIKIIMALFNNSYAGRMTTDFKSTARSVFAALSTRLENVPWVKAFNWLYGMKSSDFVDGVHPNEKTSKLIANYITDLVEGTYDPEHVNIEYNIESGAGSTHQTAYIRFKAGHDTPEFVGARYIGSANQGQTLNDIGTELVGKDFSNIYSDILMLNGYSGNGNFINTFIRCDLDSAQCWTMNWRAQLTGGDNLYFTHSI